ncbi:hypothetical protein LPJ75_003592 [Coemansia sp. RSA 2598]|nr:hypothetical protein LPJ75_003592 [Coemansia sp. RSA 2598]
MSCVICCESLLEHLGGQNTGSSGSSGGARSDWQTQPSVLCCGHVFHQGCISAWLAHSTRKSCPTCRKRQTGDPIAIYFEFDAQPDAGSSEQASPTISQLQHRNHMIRTLCTNIEQAQSEANKAKEELGDLRKQYMEKCSEHHAEAVKSKSLRDRVVGSKKAIADLKIANMKLDKTVAEQARQIEALGAQLETTRAELEEQKRVVANMGDVRAANEGLARSLKKEKSRNETLTTLNAQLASKVSSLEKPATSSDRAHRDTTEGSSLGVGRIEEKRQNGALASTETSANTCHLITDTDSDLEEDATAITSSIEASRTRASTGVRAQPSTKLASTFELPLTAIHTAESASARNPFAIAASGGRDPGPSEFLFSLSLDSIDLSRKSIPIGGSLGKSTNLCSGAGDQKASSPAVPLMSLKYPSRTLVSDGMGGSRRKSSVKGSRGGGGAKGKRPAGTIQAKINWSFKRQD